MAYATLGEYVFERLIGFADFETTGKERYAQHNLINLQPRLDHTGTELRTIKFGVHYHRSFCVPEDEIAQLWAAKNTAAINPLVLGNGRVIGNFVIEEIIETIKVTFDDGTYIDASISISLLECVIQDKAAQSQSDATKNAKALSGNNPNVIRGQIKGAENFTDQMSAAADKAFAESKSIGDDIDSAFNDFEKFQLKTQQIISRVNKAVGYINTAVDILNSPDYVGSLLELCSFTPWTGQCAALASDLTSMKGSLLDILSFTPIEVGTINDINDINITVKAKSKAAKKSKSPFAAQKGLRRI